MPTIIGIAGSTRTGSYNRALLGAATALAPEGTRVNTVSIEAIPLYDADLEKESGVPDAVSEIKDAIAGSDGLLLVTPEYNHSIPGVFKNAIDWLTRPPSDIPRVFGGRPVALMGATPGRAGTALAQAAWLPVLQTLGTKPWFGASVTVSRAADVFDEDGNLVDESVRERVQKFMAGFAEAIGTRG